MNTRSIVQALALPLLAPIVLGAYACDAERPGPAQYSVRSTSALGEAAPGLGSAKSFAVLGGSTITSSGPTIVNGDLGVSPGLAVTGFPPGIVTGGVMHAGGAVALQAQADATTAFDTLAGQACDVDLSGTDLGGLTLTPGVYCFSSAAQLTGALVLDAGGRADAVFVFKTASTLTSASNASVQVINGGSDCGVFWQIGSSVTLGTGTAFAGSILALASITLTTGVKVSGRTLARTGAVTMDTNAVSLPVCTASPTPPSTDGGVPDAEVLDASSPPPDATAPPSGGSSGQTW